jgi:capsular polysaccharide biosynthesis protein
VRVAAFVMSQFRETRLFHTNSHPTGELMVFMLAQLFAVPALRDLIWLPYDELVRGARVWADTSDVFAGEEAPVHPAVAAHFGLRWWSRDLRYSWLGKHRTFDQWIDWYLRYQPGEAEPVTEPEAAAKAPVAQAAVVAPVRVPAGPWLDHFWRSGELADAVVLAPRTEVARTPFLVEGAIDPALAKFGHFFSDPDYRRYTAVESLLGRLHGASVVGNEGVVIHNGAVLRDTMRHINAGPTAPAVRAREAEALVLAPGLRRRHFAGPAMCCHSGSWRTYANWLHEALPRLAAFLLVRQQVPGVKLLLPLLDPQSFQAETLSLLGIRPEEIEPVAADEIVTCDELYVTSAFDLWSVPPYCREAADLLVARAGRFLPLPSRALDRVYLHRRNGTRRVANFDALVGLLVQRGFRIVDCESLPLTEQIAMLRGANTVVAEHGVALENLLFCQSGARVLELFNPACVQPAYWSMASASRLQYGFVVGNHVVSEGRPLPDWNTDYKIDSAMLADALDTLRDARAEQEIA